MEVFNINWSKIVIFFHTPLTFDAPVRGLPLEYCHSVWCGKTRVVGLLDGEKIEDVYNRLDRIPACDGPADGQTYILPRHNPRYAYASRGKNRRQTIRLNTY